jgi:hypothetical protein
MFELLGDPDFINIEIDKYRAVTRKMVRETAIKYLTPENCSTISYLSSCND